ncbi:MAG: gamma-glutamyltransferase [Gammaproteobacteria bacterium]
MGKTAGVVAAGHELTAQAAESVLLEGGNAFDAVLAALATACVAEPVLASLGGGGFLLARPVGEVPRLYDFFVQTPRHLRAQTELDFRPILADFGTAQQEFHIGRGAIAVPGVVRGLFEVHRELASIPLRQLVLPAIQCALDGVIVNPLQAYIYGVVGAIYRDTPEARAIYTRAATPGVLISEGERLRQPDLADVLETLAIEGDDLFYRGEIAHQLARDMQSGGHLTLEDLASYRVQKRRPLAMSYRESTLFSNPSPSVGGTLIGFGLKLLQEFQLPSFAFGSAEQVALLARVLELSGEARLEVQADDSVDWPDAEKLLAPERLARYRAELARRIQSRRGTTHISIIDGGGNIASLSLSNGEGSGYVVPGTGIMLNNMLGEQDLNPRGFHLWRSDQRLSSMMAPCIVLYSNGDTIATGSGGSNRIRSAILQVLSNLVDFRMEVTEAVHAPRIHYEAGLLSVEGGFDLTRIAPVLERFPKHQIWSQRNLFFGGVHTVLAGHGGLRGAGDPRRSGVCLVVNG